MPHTLRQFKATIFQALAHPTRIAILELLQAGEMPVAVLIDNLGLEPANVSQHLAVLRSNHIITSRKEGHQVFYQIRDSRISEILGLMRSYFEAHIEETLGLLRSEAADLSGRDKVGVA